MVINKSNGFEVVDIEKILYLKGDGNYTNICTEDKNKITSSRNLGQFENLLADLGFFRVHISTLVHLKYVKAYSSENGGQIEMKDGNFFKLSRYRKEAFLNRFY